jgi:hypothetical protein
VPLEAAAASVVAGWADGADAAAGGEEADGVEGAEDEKNEEHPARAGQTASEKTMRDRLAPLPRPVLRTFGRVGSSFPIQSLYPAHAVRLNYERTALYIMTTT